MYKALEDCISVNCTSKTWLTAKVWNKQCYDVCTISEQSEWSSQDLMMAALPLWKMMLVWPSVTRIQLTLNSTELWTTQASWATSPAATDTLSARTITGGGSSSTDTRIRRQQIRTISASTSRPTSRSRKPLRLAEDILRLASRLAAAYGWNRLTTDYRRSRSKHFVGDLRHF